jgi:hypothetical protein
MRTSGGPAASGETEAATAAGAAWEGRRRSPGSRPPSQRPSGPSRRRTERERASMTSVCVCARACARACAVRTTRAESRTSPNLCAFDIARAGEVPWDTHVSQRAPQARTASHGHPTYTNGRLGYARRPTAIPRIPTGALGTHGVPGHPTHTNGRLGYAPRPTAIPRIPTGALGTHGVPRPSHVYQRTPWVRTALSGQPRITNGSANGPHVVPVVPGGSPRIPTGASGTHGVPGSTHTRPSPAVKKVGGRLGSGPW